MSLEPDIATLYLIELYTHWQAGRSLVQLRQSLGMAPKTIRKYVAPAIVEGIQPGGEPLTAEQWADKIAEWFPGLDDHNARPWTPLPPPPAWAARRRPGRQPTVSVLIEPHRSRIKDWLDAGATVAMIMQRLRDDHAVTVSTSSVQRWLTTYLSEELVRTARARRTRTLSADLRNANARRSAGAAVTTVARVDRALEILGDSVPDHLAAVGKLRVEHRQASLEELGQLASSPMTKDAVAGRLRRLLGMADRQAKVHSITNPNVTGQVAAGRVGLV